IRPTAIYSRVFVQAALAVPFIPLEWAGKKNGLSILLAARGEEVRTELQQFGDDLVLATPSYSKSALLGYLMRQPVAVIGPGSYHGRQDDIVTDLRQFDGRDILLVTDHAGEMERTRDWFGSSEVLEPEVAGSRFYVVLGRDFDFPRYREDVLSPVAEKYYRIPPWLQPFAGPNFFRERYDLPQSQPLPSH
ncbi:MAG TPA: hypothetical protein VHF69_06850, partial [Candidatus Synoicihabitans sp.]|nr:hypothetical protein [Candidatus Synoicihabitans sp.]